MDEKSLKMQAALEEIVSLEPHFYTEVVSEKHGTRRLPSVLIPWAGPLRVLFTVAHQALGTYEKDKEN